MTVEASSHACRVPNMQRSKLSSFLRQDPQQQRQRAGLNFVHSPVIVQDVVDDFREVIVRCIDPSDHKHLQGETTTLTDHSPSIDHRSYPLSELTENLLRQTRC